MASTLCEDCRQVNLHQLVLGRRTPTSKGNHDYYWKPKKWPKETPLCPLCSLVRHCLLSNADIEESDLALGGLVCGIHDRHEIRLTYLPPDYGRPRLVWHSIHQCNWSGRGGKREEGGTNGDDASVNAAVTPIPLGSTTTAGADSDALLVEAVSPFNLRDLLGWLAFCRERHCDTGCARDVATMNSPDTAGARFSLIDTRDGCVVEGQPGMDYFALSYVWGHVAQLKLTRANCAALGRPGSLWANTGIPLPGTISDAIAFCRACDQRYLWVDSLCILQDGGDVKHDQIQAIDLIYLRASLTIIAAAGSDANSGLLPCPLGTSSAGEPLLVRQDIGIDIDGIGVSFCTVPSWRRTADAIKRSAWASRGWTLQEEVLSRRKVYFAGDAVFRCHVGVAGSEFGLSLAGSSLSLAGWGLDGLPGWANSLNTLPIDMLSSWSSSRQRRWQLIDVFTHLVSEYLPRTLTFPDDILNAFQGILTRMSRLGLIHTWGLPAQQLPNSLLWIRRGLAPITRRRGFPSWSWAGWTLAASPRSVTSLEKTTWTSWKEWWDNYPLNWGPRLLEATSLLSCYGVNGEGALMQLSAGDVQAVLALCVREGNREKYEDQNIDLDLGNMVWTRFTLEHVEQFKPRHEDHLRELMTNAMELVRGTGAGAAPAVPLQHLMMFWTSIGRVRLTPSSPHDENGAADARPVAEYAVWPITPVDEADRRNLRHTPPVALGRDLHTEHGGEFYAAVIDIPEIMACYGETSWEFEALYGILILVKQDNNIFVRVQAALVCATKWALCRPEGGLVMLV